MEHFERALLYRKPSPEESEGSSLLDDDMDSPVTPRRFQDSCFLSLEIEFGLTLWSSGHKHELQVAVTRLPGIPRRPNPPGDYE
jgi:hypothetical protein